MIYTVTLNPAVDREYVVPRLVPNSVLRASQVHIDYGGKGLNVSRMLNALGMGSTALGFIGRNAGAFLESGLTSLGITTDFVNISQETRTNTTIVESEGRDHYKVNETGPIISIEEQHKLVDKVKKRIKAEDWWVLAGSLPPGVPATFYRELITIIQSAGANAILDSSGEALNEGVKAKPFLIKPNIIEAQSLTGVKGRTLNDMEEMQKTIHNWGIRISLISAGKRTSILSDRVSIWHSTPPKIEEANPVGAGDAMLAGLLFGYLTEEEISKAFAWGIAAGSAAARKPGTAMPTKREVEDLIKDVEIKEIENAL